MKVVIRLIRFIPAKLFNKAETIAKPDSTKMTGISTLNELETAGGMLSPKLICRRFM